MRLLLRKFFCGKDGAVAIEYALIGGLISIIILASLQSIGTNIRNMFLNPISSALSSSSSSSSSGSTPSTP